MVAENLTLRQQLAVLQVSAKRPRLRRRDRLFWVWLSRLWSGWRPCLMIVQPETVIRWHREGFRLYWRWRSRKKRGRPKTDAEIRALIRRMARENPLWGAPRIQSELALLGWTVAESTVGKYLGRARKPPSQTWRTFLENHVRDIVAVDFFVVVWHDPLDAVWTAANALMDLGDTLRAKAGIADPGPSELFSARDPDADGAKPVAAGITEITPT